MQAWAMEHDAALALRLAGALGWWWFLRGRLPGEYPVLRQAAELAGAGSGGWCAASLTGTAVQGQDRANPDQMVCEVGE